MKRQNVRTLALIVCTFTYLLLGAAIFDALESEMEGHERKRLQEQERAWRDKYNITREDFEKITQLGIQLKPYKAGTQWKFAGAFYFATTVITTIGYGHCTPKTVGGKIFCMLYALPGIPLCIVMFQSIGERMNTLVTCLLRRLKSLFKCQNKLVSQTHLILFSANIGTIVLTVGAAVFAQYERWHYLDAFYYCFITLTTIGFGDFVAMQREDSLVKQPDYVAFSLIFILFGLTVVSSAMNLLVLRFLTMNTDDQRRDEQEAAAQAQEFRRLHGDVIHSVIGMTGHIIQAGDEAKLQHHRGPERLRKFLQNSPPVYRENSRAFLQSEEPSTSLLSRAGRSVQRMFKCLGRQGRIHRVGSRRRRSAELETKVARTKAMEEERVTFSLSFSEFTNMDADEYSPWVSRNCEQKNRPTRRLSQENLLFGITGESSPALREAESTWMRNLCPTNGRDLGEVSYKTLDKVLGEDTTAQTKCSSTSHYLQHFPFRHVEPAYFIEGCKLQQRNHCYCHSQASSGEVIVQETPCPNSTAFYSCQREKANLHQRKSPTIATVFPGLLPNYPTGFVTSVNRTGEIGAGFLNSAIDYGRTAIPEFAKYPILRCLPLFCT
ncbi:hypothetical protein AAHC03_025962 [Spirometra sp. Aus1]